MRPSVRSLTQPRERLVSRVDEGEETQFDRPTPVQTVTVGASLTTRADRAVIVRLQGAAAGEPTRVPEQGLKVGRGVETDLRFDDDDVSRVHAVIQYEPGTGYVVLDLGSRNGTTVNAQRVTRRVLRDGDVLRFGAHSALRFSWVAQDEEDLLKHLYASSTCDLLTGAFNRRYFEQRFRSELAYALRHETELSLLLVDIDHFKLVNDTLGHSGGDAVLRDVAEIATARLRTEDVLARYGGEEFIVLLRNVGLAGAGRAGERLRAAIADNLAVTVSIGCASLVECEEPIQQSLIEHADRRLYIAKRTGRNRVVTDG